MLFPRLGTLAVALLAWQCGGPVSQARHAEASASADSAALSPTASPEANTSFDFQAILGPAPAGAEMLGKPAPSLAGVRWLDGKEHPLAEDRGTVTLIRWWTNTCPFCKNSAPALRALSDKYGADLRIRAVFHEKPARRVVGANEIVESAARLGYPFLLGHDEGWTALRRWWLEGRRRAFTSVSFLLDREGILRLIHTGGEYHTREQVDAENCVREPDACERDYRELDRAIAALSGRSGSSPAE